VLLPEKIAMISLNYLVSGSSEKPPSGNYSSMKLENLALSSFIYSSLTPELEERPVL
jgi:hypothetical protein